MQLLNMKLHLPSLLRTAIMACMACMACSTPLHADSCLAEGVVIRSLEDIDGDYYVDVVLDTNASNRFYDGGKGTYWDKSVISREASKLFTASGNSYSFLGQTLSSYLPTDATSFSTSDFAALQDDGGNCWAYTSANVLQYWQSYYGVFASNPSALAYGHSYDKANLEKLAGTQSLNLNMAFYKGWQNRGGEFQYALGWYLGGLNGYSGLKDSEAEAPGCFKEYFPNATMTGGCDNYLGVYSGLSLEDFSHGVKTRFGYEKQGDGTYKQTTKGQILYLDISGVSKAGSHAITCYGFDTDASGNVTSLYITNSDDQDYALVKLDVVRTENGYMLRYGDSYPSMDWLYNGKSWQITGINTINTPQVLKDMLAEYSDTTKPLYWNGQTTSWDSTAGDALESLPDDTTGWVAAANNSYYSIYYDKNRAVVFDDSAAGSNRSINLTNDVSAAAMTVNNSASDYSFSGSYTVSAGSLTKSGTQKAIFTGVTLSMPTTTISGGTLELGTGASIVGTSINVSNQGSTLHFNGGSATLTGELTLGSGTTLTLANGTAITASRVSGTAGATVSMAMDATSAQSSSLTLTGTLALGSTTLEIDFGDTYIRNTTTYTLATATGGILLDSLNSFTVKGDYYSSERYSSQLEQSADGKTLSLIVTQFAGEVCEWSGNGSAGEGSNWSSGQTPGAGDTVLLSGGGSETITISAAQTVDTLIVNSSAKGYELTGEGTLQTVKLNIQDGKLTISNARTDVDGALVVGSKGELEVTQGSLLAVGTGSRLGTVSGAGSFEIKGNTTAASLGDVQKLSILNDASLEVDEAVTVNGAFTSTAGGSFSSASGISFATSGVTGGHVSAPQITVTGSANSFTTLSASSLVLQGELNATTPAISVESLIPQTSEFSIAPQADTPVNVVVEDTDAAANTYGLIATQNGIAATAFTLDAETLRDFRRNNMDASLSDDGSTLSLILEYNEAGYYERAAKTENGRAAARLLDEIWLSDEVTQGSSPDLDALFADLTDFRDTGNNAQLDSVAAAAAGASIPALGIAYAGDVSRQLRSIRNRMTTMGVDSRYEHPEIPYVNAWINAEGDYRQLDDDGTAAGFTLSSWGGTVGVDVDTTENLTLGLACSALYGDFEASGVDEAEGDLDTYYATLFARLASGSWIHSFVMTAGVADISLDRTVRHGSGSYKTQGSADGCSWGFLYELAYTISATEDESICWQPVMNISYVHAAIDAYTETGSDAALSIAEQEFDQLSFGVGARMQAIVAENLYERHSVLELRALLKADVGDREGEADIAFTALPGSMTTLKSNDYGAIGVELGAGLTVPISSDSGELFLDASADLRDGHSEVTASAGWRVHF